MARFSATQHDTEETHWEAADLVRTDYFRDEVGENIEYIAQTHQHRRDTASDGAVLVLEHADEILFRMGAA